MNVLSGAIRLLLTPIGIETEGGSTQFVGAELDLVRFGGGTSAALQDTPSPATLALQGRFLERARGDRKESVRELARLEGEVLFQGVPARPVFIGRLDENGQARGWTLHPEPEAAHAREDQSRRTSEDFPEPSRRVLRVEFASSHFQNVPRGIRAEVVFDVDARQHRHLELCAALEIGGNTEASFEVNDVLDVLVTRTHPPRLPDLVTVRLTDEGGKALGGASCRVRTGAELTPGGFEGVSDGDGHVELRPEVGAERCELEWSTPSGVYTRELFLKLETGDTALTRRLQNLGYAAGPTVEHDVRAFQREFQREETGELMHVAEALIAWHDRGELPPLGAALVLDNDPVVFSGPSDAEDRSDSTEELG